MSRARLQCLSLVAVLFLVATVEVSHATTVMMPSDQEMVIGARAIVVGKVIAITASVDQDRGIVMSYVRLRVEEVVSGEVSEQEIVLRQPGGETPSLGTLIFGMPRFAVDQELLLYLDTWKDGSLRVYQGYLGKFNIVADPSTGRLRVERDDDRDVLVLPHSGVGGAQSLEFQGYLATVRRLVEETRESHRLFERTYFPDTPVLSIPPEYHLVGEQVTPMWALQNPNTPLRWFEPDSGQPVVFYINTANAPGDDIVADMVAGMTAWSTAAGTSVRLTNAGDTTGCGVQLADGKNTISFNNCDNYFSPSAGCTGILAVSGIVRYYPTQTRTINGRVFSKAQEANVAFNPYLFCNFSNRCQIQEVATHELGHAIGLGHSTDAAATMAPIAHYDNRCALLNADDVAGVAFIYPGSSAGGRLEISTGAELPTADTGTYYAKTLEATGGAGSYAWRLLSGQLSTGLLLSPSGLIHGTPTGPGSFSFTAEVRDASGNSTQGTFSLTVRPPLPAPEITGTRYRKKRVTIYGNNFSDSSSVYLDDSRIGSSFDGSSLVTKKRRLEAGQHNVYVVNSDGKQSARSYFTLE